MGYKWLAEVHREVPWTHGPGADGVRLYPGPETNCLSYDVAIAEARASVNSGRCREA